MADVQSHLKRLTLTLNPVATGSGSGSDVPFSVKVAYVAEKCVTLSPAFVAFVAKHAAALDGMIRYERNATNHTYFSLRTLERSYLISVDGLCIESPQDMWMRVAVAINMSDEDEDVETVLARIQACYEAMSTGMYTHATPTLFNAGMRVQQLSSCYLAGTSDDLSGIYETLADCAQISKWAGGIGLHVSNVRAKGTVIKSTNGTSDGIIPMLQVFNSTARYCNQSGRRKGSIAVYLEPWHADVWEFVELRKNTGAETERARDLFLALWVPDEFMERLERDDDWYLMSHDTCPGLIDAYGADFSALYNKYVQEGRYVRSVKARALWQHIISCQLETGTPYILYKDHVNRKCNQSNVGTIRSSNLCSEITQYSDDKEYAVCNLASISIPKHVDPKTNTIDHATLHETARQITYNLNRLIDMNDYPTPKADVSNKALRPIGIGIQGLGDVYCMLKLPYNDPRALQIDEEVMETIYHGAMTASVELAIKEGPYPRFQGSPASKGQLQMDLWGHKPASGRYDWDAMRSKVVAHGLRNSMLTALMPTASTSQVLGNCESFEPFQSNVFKRTTMAGEFLVVNRHLMKDLMAAGLWSDELRKELVQQDGSLQNIEGVPDDLKRVYATVWDVPQRAVIDHAAARGPYVDQSQSMNLYMQSPSFQKLSRALIYAWQKGLKTGLYYLRSAPAKEAVKYGGIKRSATATATATATASAAATGAMTEVVDVSNDDGPSNTPDVEIVACKLRRAGDDGEVCEMCSA
jgi:ribonucleoside-diphosphate reductase alpha chain